RTQNGYRRRRFELTRQPCRLPQPSRTENVRENQPRQTEREPAADQGKREVLSGRDRYPKANRRTDERADRPERRKSERLCRDESTGDQSDETEGHRDRDPRRPVGSGIERAHPGGDPDGEGCESRDTENDREKV